MDEIVKFDELPSIKRGYIDGLKYYFSIILSKQASLIEFKDLYQNLTKFNLELEKLNQEASDASVETLNEINATFYPDGKMHSAFRALNLEVALDGISECLMYLKKRVI
ncbi:MAG: hypothetical protein K6C35_08930 [Eubacterium sp.]|nr:hypothetical protein [Eubacterium sp.]